MDYYNSENITVKMKNLFNLIEQKRPDKFDDLFFYFILLPPSKIDHIENTVKKWIK